ncbi:MAG: hypothetical protein HYS05_17190 [Acidobacteria bacterium]|nr:hypothetical protein [Acidobacteriota bacterium]
MYPPPQQEASIYVSVFHIHLRLLAGRSLTWPPWYGFARPGTDPGRADWRLPPQEAEAGLHLRDAGGDTS